MSGSELAGVGVLVTRPAGQAEGLCRLIEAHGGRAIRFPVLEILDPPELTPLFTLLDRLERFDLAIFISPNAVGRSLNLIRSRRGELPPGLMLATVGRGSARELKRLLGREPDLCPEGRFDSEALLALPQLQAVAGRRIIIFRGEGGRELLADALRERGATVEYAEVYRRRRPAADSGALLRRWARGEVDIVTVTSAEGLHNLYEMVGELGRTWLRRTPLVVISERTAVRARELGFEQPALVAPQAGDEALVETVMAWAARRPAAGDQE